MVTGVQTCALPILGSDLEDAKATLTQAGLNYNTQTSQESTTDQSLNGRTVVISVNPGEGTSVSDGSSVELTVTTYTYHEPTPTPTATATATATGSASPSAPPNNN